MPDTAFLNERQIEAVKTIHGPLLIIAGAGSGKTRTITYRIAEMLNLGIDPQSILALTFTNKAAREMTGRVTALTGKAARKIVVGTFHSFGVRILRESIGVLGWKRNFSIYDQADKINLLKEAARNIRMRETVDLYYAGSLFSAVKTGRSPLEGNEAVLKDLFNEYQALLKAYNAVDFDDLITLSTTVFSREGEILQKFRDRFRYIMVDEFQDTSAAQYELLHLLGSEHRNICAVGDDDQSIYSWRGADYRNILSFERDFPEVREIKLEQNYRSSGNILSAANFLISNNKNRKTKKLWTGGGSGRHIEYFQPEDGYDEAGFIARTIRELSAKENKRYHDFGVLVRTNSLTSVIEEVFLRENIPYRVSGGTSFFQRREVKDIIAYLRLLLNPDDDIQFFRIINTPRRGIGRTTLGRIREVSDKQKIGMFSAAEALVRAGDSPLSGRMKKSLEEFIELVHEFEEEIEKNRRLSETVRHLVDRIDYWSYLVQDNPTGGRIAKWKFGNVERFVGMIESWERDPDNMDKNPWAFLNRITLTTRDEDSDEEQGKVGLMTIHAAKGLEFNTVFLPALENGILPHRRSIEENGDNLEEERRLFYVAITRAKDRLYLTSCRKRKILREELEAEVSPFVDELPKELLQYHTPEKAAGPGDVAAMFADFYSRHGSKNNRDT